MALEDRDWYREEPSKAWRTRWNPTQGTRTPTSTGEKTTRGRIRVYYAALPAILVSLGLFIAAWQFDIRPTIRIPGNDPAPRKLAPRPPPAAPPPASAGTCGCAGRR